MIKFYKKVIKVYLSIIILFPLLVIGIFYYYDPMQIFHKSYLKKDLYLHENMRQQAAGIINNYEFDSIILGTSMLENTSSLEASKLLGGDFVNISLSGSDFYERNLVLSYAIKLKKIKRVIYSLDSFAYLDQRKGDPLYPIETFHYLYDSNSFNDIKAYWNDKFFKCIIKFSEEPICIGNKKTFEYPNVWFTNKSHSDRFGGLENWFKAQNNAPIKDTFPSITFYIDKIKKNEKISLDKIDEKIKKAKEYVDETLLQNVSKYPNTEFIMVFPPYSRMNYAMWTQCNLPYYELHKVIIKYLTEKSNEYKNLKIYGFEDNDFLDNISNYKDIFHYHQSINSMMLENFKNQKGLLTITNVDNYIKISEEKALNYNVNDIADKIEEYLKKNN